MTVAEVWPVLRPAPAGLPLLLAALLLCVSPGSAEPDQDDNQDDDEVLEEWVVRGGWVLLVVGALAMFYGLAVIVEDFFVPALNVMCDRFQIPDDVAGATFMAAGASSPEMFSAFISLFITHSSLGAGTIIGSEIFNHLIICAGSVMYSRGGVLQLDWRLVLREVVFYALALGLLLYAMSDDSKHGTGKCKRIVKDKLDDDDALDGGRFCISWYQGAILLLGYVLYALVCANYETVSQALCGQRDNAVEGKSAVEGQEEAAAPASEFDGTMRTSLLEDGKLDALDALPDASRRSSVRLQVQNEPVENIRREVVISNRGQKAGDALRPRGSLAPRPSIDIQHMNSNIVYQPETLFLSALSGPLIGQNLLANIEETQGSPTSEYFGCYLWKRSRFYSKMPLSRQAWQLRWVVIDQNGFRSFRNRKSVSGVRAFNVYEATRIEPFDTRRLILWMATPQGSLYFQAPSEEVFSDVITALHRRLATYRELSTAQRQYLHSQSQQRPLTMSVDELSTSLEFAPADANADVNDGDEDDHSLLSWPDGMFSVLCHVLLLPLKALLHYTIPDVRTQGNGDDKWPQAVTMCFVWLILLSYVMTVCLEKIGQLIGVNSLVMGMTVSAAGTSFPNVFASMIVARQGLGNMAVSNALGGNVFNIFMGLGLPWTLYTLLGSYEVDRADFMYYGMEAGGIIFPIIVLLVLLAGYVILLLCTGWRLFKSHAYLFVALYIAFLVWVVAFNTVAPPGIGR